jgi:hypothetical protein
MVLAGLKQVEVCDYRMGTRDKFFRSCAELAYGRVAIDVLVLAITRQNGSSNKISTVASAGRCMGIQVTDRRDSHGHSVEGEYMNQRSDCTNLSCVSNAIHWRFCAGMLLGKFFLRRVNGIWMRSGFNVMVSSRRVV